MDQPILENLWWAISGKLAGVRMPKAEELAELQTVGVGAIASVYHEATNLDLYQQANMPHLWLPIAIDTAPSLDQIQKFQNFVEQHNQSGHAVAVHCSTGKHRTGTMLAAYLMKTGISYEQAMETVLTASSQAQLPDAQTQFLQTFALIQSRA